MTKNAFSKFVSDQGKAADDKSVDDELVEWLAFLSELYVRTENSLLDYLQPGVLEVRYSPIELHEELVGTYSAEQQIILVGKNTVRLTPIGTFLIGTKGRVDMEGPRGVARLILAPKGATAPQVSFSSTTNPTTSPSPPIEWVWKFSTPPPQIRYTELTDETFRTALMRVVNGNAS